MSNLSYISNEEINIRELNSILNHTTILQAKTKKGTYKYWQAFIYEENSNIYIQTSYWSSNIDGSLTAKQYSSPTLVLGKNTGKKNQTTNLEQALKNLDSLVNRQLSKGYIKYDKEDEANQGIVPLPMLAFDYKKQQKQVEAKLPTGLFIQPKLDGVRMLFDGTKGWSRQGKLFLPEVLQHLLTNTNQYILDGELILPPPYSFQETVSAIKKYRESLSPLIEYHVYDLVLADTPFTIRQEYLKTLYLEGLPLNIKIVPTDLIKTKEALDRIHYIYIEEGYEGSMLRYPDSLYEIGFRSRYLLKNKDFDNDDYLIVNVKEGSGADTGAIIFECQIPNSECTFSCRPALSYEERKNLYQKGKDEFIGKLLTIKHQGLTDTLVPRFPVGISLRDYE